MKISKRAVDRLAANGSAAVLWDSEVRGFGIRCRPSGAKHYVLKLRVGGRQRWIRQQAGMGLPCMPKPHDMKP